MWRRVIHEKYNGRCAICGKEPIQCHHIFSRRFSVVRWDVDNGIGLCYFHHHRFAHSDYERFRDVVIELIGQDVFEALKERAYSGKKLTLLDLDRIKEELEVWNT